MAQSGKRSVRSREWLFLGIAVAASAGAAAFGVWGTAGPAPPLPNFDRLDDLTTAEIMNLREATRSNSAESWQELAEAFMAYGYLSEAEACYQQRASRGPTTFAAIFGWAFCLERLGRLDEAIQRFREAEPLAEGPLRSTCRYHIGRCYLRSGRASDAEQTFRELRDFPPAQFHLARILVRSERAAEAVPLLETLNTRYPNALEPNLLRSRAERALGNEELAAAFGDRAERAFDSLPLNDTNDFLNPIRFRYGLSRKVYEWQRIRQQQGSARALTGFRLLVRGSDYWYARRLIPELADLECEAGEPAEAVRILSELFEHSNNTPETLGKLGNALWLEGRTTEAVDVWRRALDIREREDLHRRLAEYHQERAEHSQRDAHLARAWHCAGCELFRRNDIDDALRAFERAVELEAKQHDTWFYLGECRRARGEIAAAAECYRSCLRLAPTNGRAAAALARVSLSESTEQEPAGRYEPLNAGEF